MVLPIPAGLGKKKPVLPGGHNVKAVQFREKVYGKHLVEFGKKGNALIFHFYKDGVFPMSFRGKLYRAFVGNLSFGGRESELLDISWVPEFDSWCVIIKDIPSLSPPPSSEDIDVLLESLFY